MTEATSATPAPDALAGVLADAPFVRLVATDDGDALAATGLLARALRAAGTPFQARVDPDPVPDDVDGGVAVTVGVDRGRHAIPGTGRPASTAAFAVARALGVEPDPVVALAGVVAAGSIPGADGSGDALEAAERADRVERRPGVALPVAGEGDPDAAAASTGADTDPSRAEALAASTLVSTRYSGDPAAARDALAPLGLPAGLDADDRRRFASLVAVDAADGDGAGDRAASSAERVLRPYATDGPFETVGGYADVLDALAREAPGTGIALALATDPDESLRTAALDAWRRHGLAAHSALEAATIGRYDGCVVARVDAAAVDAEPSVLPTVARLVRDFRSPEPVAVAVDESVGRLAAAGTGGRRAVGDAATGGGHTGDDAATEPVGLGNACRTAAGEVGANGWGTVVRGAIAVDDSDGDGLTRALAALREAI
ncbi:exonuclease RecJ [Halorubrum sp. BOL3-1]|uniref:exonuclease RecJ n=1 Tax=Halorubrum sp. BOL3-1 TaxID=2497325 RepID=UPI0010051E39|nr:exonuclease RecJ [Halorubrum sp. BOL3-1]QAU12717.1 exonuclease RecJ [Halorubrum sp. BOL3-1]